MLNSFEKIKKRALLLPFSMLFSRRECLVPNLLMNDVDKMFYFVIDTEKTILRLNYPDAYLFNETLKY